MSFLCDSCVHFSDSQLPQPMGSRLPQTPTLGLCHTRNLPWQCLGFYHCCNSHTAHSCMLTASAVLIQTMNCLCSLLRHTMWHLPVSYFTIIWWGDLEFLKGELVKRKKKFYPVLKNWNTITMEGVRSLYESTMGGLQMEWLNEGILEFSGFTLSVINIIDWVILFYHWRSWLTWVSRSTH